MVVSVVLVVVVAVLVVVVVLMLVVVREGGGLSWGADCSGAVIPDESLKTLQFLQQYLIGVGFGVGGRAVGGGCVGGGGGGSGGFGDGVGAGVGLLSLLLLLVLVSATLSHLHTPLDPHGASLFFLQMRGQGVFGEGKDALSAYSSTGVSGAGKSVPGSSGGSGSGWGKTPPPTGNRKVLMDKASPVVGSLNRKSVQSSPSAGGGGGVGGGGGQGKGSKTKKPP